MSSHPVTIFRWLGQACFLITLIHGTTILIDPPHPEVGYKIAAHSIQADAVFVSHEHPDHNFTDAAIGSPLTVQPLTDPTSGVVHGSIPADNRNPKAIPWQRIFAWHDNVQGAQRGPDTITVINADGLRICHLGDLGELQLTPEQVSEIGHVDVLMIPVGGYFTIDGNQAAAIVSQLHPRVVIPMHYGTPALNADLRKLLAPSTVFVNAMKRKAKIVPVTTRDLGLSPSLMPKTTTVYLLKYE